MAKRPPRHKVNRKQRAKAISALSRIVESPTAAEYVVAKAAASIIFASKIDDDGLPEVDPDGPKTLIFLPAKQGMARPLGPQQGSNIAIFDSDTPEGLADYRRWRSEAEARGDSVLAPQ
jgi:hypothetical protein